MDINGHLNMWKELQMVTLEMSHLTFCIKNLSGYLCKLSGNYIQFHLKVSMENTWKIHKKMEVNQFSSFKMRIKICVGINIIITY